MAFGVDVEVPDLRVIVRKPDVIVNTSLIPIQPVAEFALSASFATNVSPSFTGSIDVNGDILAQGNISSSNIQTSEFKLIAGNVSLTFTGSINSGVFGVTEDVLPFISTIEYSGTIIEYVAQAPGATRIGMIMATWSGSNVVFTDISTADVGDTSDISFGFIQTGNIFKLRVNSNGSGSGPWTVQSLFKLFPNLNT
jgi:hypothetical protein